MGKAIKDAEQLEFASAVVGRLVGGGDALDLIVCCLDAVVQRHVGFGGRPSYAEELKPRFMALRSITLRVVVAYLDVQTVYGVRSPVLKDCLTVALATRSHETSEDNTFGLLPVSNRRLSVLHYVVSGLWIDRRGFLRIEVCAVRLLSRRDHSNVVLRSGEIRDDLRTPAREVVIGQDRRAGVGAASDNVL